MKWSVSFRLWHWLHAAVTLGLLGTVFLCKTFLGWRTNSEILMQRLASFQIDIFNSYSLHIAGGCHCRCDRREGHCF